MSNLKDELWKDSWETWYAVYFVELLAIPVATRWGAFDLLTRSVVAITASGSAVAGWQFWQDPRYKIIWVLIAGTASIISIFHSVFHVSSKVKYWSDAKGKCSTLRHKLQILRYRLKTESENVKKLNNEYLGYRDDYANLDRSIADDDLFITKKLRNRIQVQLDAIVKTNGSSRIPELNQERT